MRIGFVHDRIVATGGAEKVFFDLIKEYEQGDECEIFTVFSTLKNLNTNGKNYKINSVISNEFLIKKIGYRNMMPVFPILTKILSYKINKFNPQKVIISSFAIGKNIDVKCEKILYLHSPMQYIRGHFEEYMNKFSGLIKLVYNLVSKYLRVRDKKYSKFDVIIFNSIYTQTLSKQIYGIQGSVKYPIINDKFFKESVGNEIQNYYVYTGRLVKFVKELDKIINFFNQGNDKLLIIGSGPDEEYLKSIAGDNIIFLGFLDYENNDEDYKHFVNILKNSKGLINITKESFGMVTAQALALGVPVFGYNDGGSVELVDQKSGVLIDKKDTKSILEGFNKFKQIKFDNNYIKENFKKLYHSKSL